MVFSDEFIEEIKAKNDIVELVSEYTTLIRKGKNMMGICPFHAERTASFCVYPANNSFYCFGCGAGGDVITFLRLTEKYDYIEAVKYLAQRVGMEFQVDEEADEIHNKKMVIYGINREAARFYHHNLMSSADSKALNYLKARGITLSTIKKFGLGYSLDKRYSLVDFLEKKGYNAKDIEMSNLAFKSRNGKYMDRFWGRVMFPIMDLRGNVIAFGARSLGAETPKYLNTSDTLVFKKSLNLFALNFAKNSEGGKLILTEGYMDVVSLHQSGFNNTIAVLGTALTTEQVKIISRYSEEVILSYDSDEAGQKATNRAISLLKNNGLKVRVLTIPNKKDPDEFIKAYGKNGAAKFKNLIQESKNDMEYKLAKIKSAYNLENFEDKIKYLTDCTKMLATSQSEIEQDMYAGRLSEDVGVNKSSILMQISKLKNQKNRKNRASDLKTIEKITSSRSDKINPDKHINLRAATAEESLISYIINNQDMANTIISRVSSDMFITEFNRRIYEAIKEIVLKKKILNITNITAQNFSLEETGRITKIICSYNQFMGTKAALDEYIEILKQEKEKSKLKNINKLTSEDVKEYIKNLKEQKK